MPHLIPSCSVRAFRSLGQGGRQRAQEAVPEFQNSIEVLGKAFSRDNSFRLAVLAKGQFQGMA